MKLALLAAATASLTGATPPPGASSDDKPDARKCQYTVQLARERLGLAPAPAPDGSALLIAAVDHRVSGCHVLMMAGDPRDIRPAPQADPGPARLQPAFQ